jgi:hypothetical protein
MAKSYRLIHGDAQEVERQLILLNAQNQEAEGKVAGQHKPILMSSAGVANPYVKGGTQIEVHVIVESE